MSLLQRIAPLAVMASLLLGATAWSAEGTDPSPEKERELIALLQSNAPPAEKALACKHLAVHGSKAATPELGKLLSNEQLASWARIALEAIPDPAADEALRGALGSLKGKLLIGAINSLGVRRDAGSVEALEGRLKDTDAEVASAAAVALGRVGNVAATQALRNVLGSAPAGVRSAVAEGCILCAERALADGRQNDAIALYDQVRKSDVPKQRIVEATRGAILARPQAEGIALLVEQLRGQDRPLFQIALSTSREIAGRGMDEALAAQLGQATPDRAALILSAMGDRPTIVLSAVLEIAQTGQKGTRLAALQALRRVGDVSSLPVLLTIAQDADAEVAAQAKQALFEIPGAAVNEEIVARLGKADGKALPLLIELVGQRRIAATASLLKAVDHADASVRTAALKALGNTITADQLSVLVAQAVKPKHADDAAIAQQALKSAAVRMADREACAAQLATAIEQSPVGTKVVLLEIVGAVGGTKALHAVGAAAKSGDAQLQDVSTRLLGEWTTTDAAPVLLDLAKTTKEDKFQSRAYRGYLRVARQMVMPEEERLAICRNAWELAKQPAEKKLVLEVLQRFPSPATLQMAVAATGTPEVKDDASAVVVAIAGKLGGKNPEVAAQLSKAGLRKVKLEIVKAEYGAGGTQKDVTEVLRKHTADLQWIALPGATFNESFGGDPAPGTVKQLRVKYMIDGKPAEATFAENALIILTMPK